MKQYILFILSFFASLTIAAQGSQVFDNLTVESKLLGTSVEFAVYLPDGYETSHRHYPVVYLLHGGGPFDKRHWQWIIFGDLQRIMDQGIKEGNIAPAIVVTANAKRSYYMNSADGKIPFEDFYIEEFIPHVEKTYRIRTGKKFRGIFGFSMGGFGALSYTFKHPELFSSCVALSSAIRTDEEIMNMPMEQYLTRHSTNMGSIAENENRVNEHWRSNHPLHLLKSVASEELKKVRYYIDCGDDDYLYKGNSMLHISMRELNITHEYRVRNGGHKWAYWHQGLKDGMVFITEGFR